MGRSELVLAIDIGTSSSRTAFFDSRGRRVPNSLFQRSYPLHTDRDGKAELDPRDLLDAIKLCITKTLSGASAVSAVGVSCFWHSVLGVNANGEAITPIYTWADSRCREDAAVMRKEFSEKDIHAETGCMLRASFMAMKLRWLYRTRKALFSKVHRWVSPGEWIQWQLTGSTSCAIGMATGTGLFNPTTLTWSPRMLKACRISAKQLSVIDDKPVQVTKLLSPKWKALVGAFWYPAIGDGATSNLGSGATESGIAAINIGTSAALRIMREGRKASAPFGLFCYRVDARRYLVGGAVSNAGNLHAWCLRELKIVPDSVALEEILAERSTPEHGLTVLPFWTAERAPTWEEDAKGVIYGMTQSTNAVDMLQAITEGFYFRLAKIAAMLSSVKGASPKWIVSGGVLKSPSALKRLSNIFGQPIYASPEPEASLRGAAVYALEQRGAKIQQLNYSTPTRPNASVHARYLAARKGQERLEALIRA
ncbi:MAG: gluconokinase [Chthoniobacterales bacterium]